MNSHQRRIKRRKDKKYEAQAILLGWVKSTKLYGYDGCWWVLYNEQNVAIDHTRSAENAIILSMRYPV